MKLTRTTKCSLKFATQAKQAVLKDVLTEYGTVVNIFIQYFWDLPDLPTKGALLKPIVEGKAEAVYGSRFLGRITGMKFRYRFFNIFKTNIYISL